MILLRLPSPTIMAGLWSMNRTRFAPLRMSFSSSSTGLPGERLPMLKQLLDSRRSQQQPLRILETHSGLTGLVVENAVGKNGVKFDGMWSSSLTASAACGMPDIEAVDTSVRLDIVKQTMNVTTKPMIYDGDTGGLPEIFKFTVRSLEQLGVSAVIIEDKDGLKQNSLLENSNSLHQLCDIDLFCDKIRAGIQARRNPDFFIIARMEALIAGRPMEEALSRALACVEAGASAIMIHSRKKSPDEVLEFISRFRSTPSCESTPIVVVPSSYNHISEAELGQAGVSICIYANHLLRASYPAMQRVAESILTHSRSFEASQDLMPIKEIINFIDHEGQMTDLPKIDHPPTIGNHTIPSLFNKQKRVIYRKPFVGEPRATFAGYATVAAAESYDVESIPRGYSSDGDSLLLTPGPLTTSTSVKAAMMHDYGSRDRKIIELTARVRQQLLSVLQGSTEQITSVLLQGSGTFAVEAMITQFVNRETGKLLIFCNGAYGRRMASICIANDRSYELVEADENMPLDLASVNKVLDSHSDATHVAVVSCETTTGVLNPVSEIAKAVSSRRMGLLIDAMSSFGVVDIDASMPFDAIAASSNKALQGSPGIGFVLARTSSLQASAGNANTLSLDLHSQWHGFQASGEWRFTPPTHCLLALGKALDEFEAEGGTSGRRQRYEANCAILVDGMRELGFETVIHDESQAPVIVTFRTPQDASFNFPRFYDNLSSKGYVIYPGKLTCEPTFRIGCIGHIFPDDMRGMLVAVRETLKEMDYRIK